MVEKVDIDICSVSDMLTTYLTIEVSHFRNTHWVFLPSRICSVDIQPMGSAIEDEVHKRTRQIELLVYDLRTRVETHKHTTAGLQKIRQYGSVRAMWALQITRQN